VQYYVGGIRRWRSTEIEGESQRMGDGTDDGKREEYEMGLPGMAGLMRTPWACENRELALKRSAAYFVQYLCAKRTGLNGANRNETS
jgi:hypothetical protein